MSIILDQRAPGLSEQLRALSSEQRRRVVASVCQAVSRSVDQLEPRLTELIQLTALVFFVVTVALVICGVGIGAAKRRPPAKIKPVQIDGIEYRAPNKIDSEGIVEAWSLMTPVRIAKRQGLPPNAPRSWRSLAIWSTVLFH